jgi:hypothetical protein
MTNSTTIPPGMGAVLHLADELITQWQDEGKLPPDFLIPVDKVISAVSAGKVWIYASEAHRVMVMIAVDNVAIREL